MAEFFQLEWVDKDRPLTFFDVSSVRNEFTLLLGQFLWLLYNALAHAVR